MRALHNRSGAHGELVAASAAQPVTGLSFALHLHFVRGAAMWQDRLTIRPTTIEDMLQGFLFIVEDWVGDVDVHEIAPCSEPYALNAVLSKVYNCQAPVDSNGGYGTWRPRKMDCCWKNAHSTARKRRRGRPSAVALPAP